jgi:6-phosphofructokinase 1
MIGISENKITKIPLLEAVAQTKKVADAIEAMDFDLAMSYRDSEFTDMLTAFQVSSSLAASERLPDSKRLRIAIVQ